MKRPFLAVSAAALAMPAAAHADTVITAQTIWRFDAPSYSITAGEKALFRNADALSPGPHNVVSEARKDGRPLFQSETIPNGRESPVAGAESAPAGSYPFICTIHPFMKATLEVKPGPPPPPPDTTAPRLEAEVRSKSRKLALKNGRLRVRLSSDERVRLAVTTSTRIRGRTRALAKRFAFEHAGGPLVVQVPLSGEARTLLRRHKRLAIRVTLRARDAAGNLAVTSATRTLR